MAPHWVFTYFCPALGTLLADAVWVSSIKAVKLAREAQNLGDLNPLPWGFGMANCICWVIYSTIINDYFVFAANCPGVILCSWYAMTALALLAKNDSAANKRKYNILEITVMSTIVLYTILAMIVGIALHGEQNYKAIVNTVGSIALVCNIAYYWSPCSTMLHVVQTRNAASLLLPMLVTNLLCATMWFFYGLLGANDPFIYIPNVLGILFATSGIILKLLLKSDVDAEKKMSVVSVGVGGVDSTTTTNPIVDNGTKNTKQDTEA